MQESFNTAWARFRDESWCLKRKRHGCEAERCVGKEEGEMKEGERQIEVDWCGAEREEK